MANIYVVVLVIPKYQYLLGSYISSFSIVLLVIVYVVIVIYKY